MNSLGHSSDEEPEKPKLGVAELKFKLQIQPTGLSADYFNELRFIQAYMQEPFYMSVLQVMQLKIKNSANWEIRTYRGYRDGVPGETGLLYDVEDSSVQKVDECVSRMNMEIDAFKTTGACNEQAFLDDWNRVNLLIYGVQNFILEAATHSS